MSWLTILVFATGWLCLILNWIETTRASRTSAAMLILTLLEDEHERYGLELVEGSRGFLSRSSIYWHLGELERMGLVESREEPCPPGCPGPPAHIPRRLYRRRPMRATGRPNGQ